jgi:FixJ family two-component response regulator
MAPHQSSGDRDPTVLLVDDDDAVLNSLRFALEIEGYKVRLYPSDRELLREPRFPETGCLVIDLRLPERDGLVALAELRERGMTLPAILITTDPSDAVRRRAADAGVAIVEKPILGNGLVDTIRAMVSAA